MIRIAIADDDAEDLKRLENMIRSVFQDSGEDCAVFPFPEGEDLLGEYNGSYDIIFLDVEMRWSNGIDVARAIRERDQDTVLIFVSRVAQYAVQGYSVDAMDYILKPLEYASFEKKLQKAVKHVLSHRAHKLRIPTDGGFRWLSSDEIRYVEVFGHFLVYHTTEGDLRVSGAIGPLEKELAPFHFIRCTRFSLVNLKYVTGVDGGDLLLGTDRVPVSRRRRKEIVDALLVYNGGGV